MNTNSLQHFTLIQSQLSIITGLEPEEITLETYLDELTLTMTPEELARFIGYVSQQFGVKLGRHELETLETINDLVEYIDDFV